MKYIKLFENFDCRDHNLSDLKGCPSEVGGYLDCSHNMLNSLEFCASEIGGTLICFNNELTNLDISSVIGGDIQCWNNKIIHNYKFYGEINGSIVFDTNQYE